MKLFINARFLQNKTITPTALMGLTTLLPTVMVQTLAKNKEVDKQISNFLFLKPIF
jgi:hypothetical protein